MLATSCYIIGCQNKKKKSSTNNNVLLHTASIYKNEYFVKSAILWLTFAHLQRNLEKKNTENLHLHL